MTEPVEGGDATAVLGGPDVRAGEMTPQAKGGDVPPPTVAALVEAAAVRYGLDPRRFAALIWCESRNDPLAHNQLDGSKGLAQFQPRTWAWASVAAGWAGASVWDAEANASVAAWLLSQPGGRRRWTCGY